MKSLVDADITEPPTKSVKWIIIGAVITAVLSGVIGAAIDAYIYRPVPSIAITSVGFRGPLRNEPIQLGDEPINTLVSIPAGQ
ncbi:MAG TPA: hypothetical protein VNY51_11660 [Candidatus Dormibacteraeota bacterium]|nr:hypothetical protein [Candidatus Dormibacteraeota bacterium]